jgi:hypothetical protein
MPPAPGPTTLKLLRPAVGLGMLLVIALLGGCTSMLPSAAPTSPSETATDPSRTAAAPTPAPTPAPTLETAAPSPTAGATDAPTSQPAASLAPTPGGWREVASFAGESLDVLAAGGPGLIAGGCRGATFDVQCGDAVIRLSVDGSTWRPAVVESSSGGSIWSIRVVDGTYVALGSRYLGGTDLRGAVWTSADAERWSLVASFPGRAPTDLVESHGRLLAVGTGLPYASEPYGFFAWAPVDVDHWGAGQEIDAPEGMLVAGAAATSEGFLAFGSNGADIPDVARRAIVGTSTDGLTWRFAPDQSSLDRATILEVGPRAGGWIAVGRSTAMGDSFVPATWRSTDGMAWTRTVDRDGRVLGLVSRGSVSTNSLLLRGVFTRTGRNLPTTWESRDGVQWKVLVPGVDLPDVPGTMPSDPVELAGRRVSVATLFEDGVPTRAVVLASP